MPLGMKFYSFFKVAPLVSRSIELEKLTFGERACGENFPIPFDSIRYTVYELEKKEREWDRAEENSYQRGKR